MQGLPADDPAVEAVGVLHRHAEHRVSAALQGRQNNANATPGLALIENLALCSALLTKATPGYVLDVSNAKGSFALSVVNVKPTKTK